MNGFEPTILAIITLIMTISEINSVLQGLLIVVTTIYTLIKIYQLLNKK